MSKLPDLGEVLDPDDGLGKRLGVGLVVELKLACSTVGATTAQKAAQMVTKATTAHRIRHV